MDRDLKPARFRRGLARVAWFVLSVTAAHAQDEPVFIPLPPGVIPTAVDGNGFTVVGTILGGGSDPQFSNQGFYWMPTTGVVPIGGTQGAGISRDGSVIVGRALDERGYENAAIWQGGTEWRVLGSFTPDAGACDRLLSGTFDVDDRGDVLVGLGWDGCRIAHGFRWEDSTGMVDLGSSVEERSSRANAVSGNGHVIVGWQDAPDGFRQGAVWRDGAQEIIVGRFGMVGEAMDTNEDGSLIVGQNCRPIDLAAWTWTPDEGVICRPVEVEGPPDGRPFITMMLATSEDGSVIGGSRSFGLTADAILWLDFGPVFVEDYLRANGVEDAFENWINTGFITGVSRDGRTVVGQGAGPINFQGYVIILPEDP